MVKETQGEELVQVIIEVDDESYAYKVGASLKKLIGDIFLNDDTEGAGFCVRDFLEYLATHDTVAVRKIEATDASIYRFTE
jgi:hypothetical protein